MPNQVGWISWFLAMEDHNFLCELEKDFIKDPYNHIGIKNLFPNFKEALEMILNDDNPDDDDLEDKAFANIYTQALDVYGLLHKKYIYTKLGMNSVREKYLNGVYGICPRVFCSGQKCLPIGMSDHLKHAKLKIYCPKCQEVYLPKKRVEDIDGAFYGMSFPNVFLKWNKELDLKHREIKRFEPVINGFKIYGKRGSNFESVTN